MNFSTEFISRAVVAVRETLGNEWSVQHGWQSNPSNDQQATITFAGVTADEQLSNVEASSGTYSVLLVLQAPQSKFNEARLYALLPAVNRAMLSQQLRFTGATCGVEDEQDRLQVLEAAYTIPSEIADAVLPPETSK